MSFTQLRFAERPRPSGLAPCAVLLGEAMRSQLDFAHVYYFSAASGDIGAFRDSFPAKALIDVLFARGGMAR